MEEEKLNLYQKLAKIRAISDAVSKDKSGYNYKYADITSILAKVTTGMKKYNVSLIPFIVPGTTHVEKNVIVKTKTARDGKPYDQTTTEMSVTGEMIFKWVNDDDPSEYLEVPWFLTGSQEDPSQGFGSAITYCTRYFLTSFFQIAQPENDVDAYRSKQKAAEAEEDKIIAQQIIATLDESVRTFLADNKDKAAEVKELMTKYVKGTGDYTKIKESALATKLLEEFNAKFINNTNT